MFEDRQPQQGSAELAGSRVRNGVLTDAGSAALSVAIPGPDLIEDLSGLDLAAHADVELTEILRAWSRIESWVTSQKARVIAAVATGRSLSTPDGFGLSNPEREEVAVALHLSGRAAENEIGFAWALMSSNAQTMRALESGSITARNARVIVEETCELNDDQTAEVEVRVLSRAKDQVPSEVRRSCRRAVHAVVPEYEAQAAVCAQQNRCVTLTPASSGMAYLEAYLPAADAQRIYNTLTQAAHLSKRRARDAMRASGLDPMQLPTIDAYRAEALTAIVGSAVRGLVEDGADLGKMQAHVVVDLPTALGLADNPGELRGYGPIPGPLARELASNADWHRWITAAVTGQLIDIGSAKYRPTASLRVLVTARDQYCRFPGCSFPAERCDLDHAQAWSEGGATTIANLGALCRRHHRIKTHTRWELIESQPNGTCTWLTPSGRRITSYVDPLLAEPVGADSDWDTGEFADGDDPASAADHDIGPPGELSA